MSTTAPPEEIECFRMPLPDGRFLPDKRYEYAYATRKSWEYIPALGRKDWRYFTNKGFTYAGKWVRSERRGWGDGGDYWEVFLNDCDTASKEHTVSWDYDGTLCWRESSPHIDANKAVDETITDAAPQRLPPSNSVATARNAFLTRNRYTAHTPLMST